MKIQILLYDGFDELDVMGPFEVLKIAQSLGADLETELVTLNATEDEITGQHGLGIRTNGRKFDVSCDVILVPGGGWVARSLHGAWTEAQKGSIPKALEAFHNSANKTKAIAAVCTGAMLLASAGLLRERNAITHHDALEALKASGANLVNARVVDDGELITSGGVRSGLDLALWLVERYFGSTILVRIEETLVYQRRGTVWRSGPFVRR